MVSEVSEAFNGLIDFFDAAKFRLAGKDFFSSVSEIL
jgi:hypothetical protein